MTKIIVNLSKGDHLLLEGELSEISCDVKLIVDASSRFVFGKYYMSPEKAEVSPARGIYYAAQNFYAGPPQARADWGRILGRRVSALHTVHSKQKLSEISTLMLIAINGEKSFGGLKLGRELIRAEDELTGYAKPQKPRVGKWYGNPLRRDARV